MSEPYVITESWEYDYCVRRGIEPLIDERHIKMEIGLRVKIQRELFGRGEIGKDIAQANEKFFRWVWEHKPHYCEETMKPLSNYSAAFCSHILTRGAFPEMATDPRNINILSVEQHNKWENGNRKEMRIYNGNMKTIEILKREYNELRQHED